MASSLDDEIKKRAMARLAARMAKESETLPYRWGYFQGVYLIPWSLLLIWSFASDLVTRHRYPWYTVTIGLLIGLLGLPLAYGLLRKREFALALVYAMFGLMLLAAAIELPTAIRHYSEPGEQASAYFDFCDLLLWLLSAAYYRRRRLQFH